MYGMVPGYFLAAHVLGARRERYVTDRSILIEHVAENCCGRRGRRDRVRPGGDELVKAGWRRGKDSMLRSGKYDGKSQALQAWVGRQDFGRWPGE